MQETRKLLNGLGGKRYDIRSLRAKLGEIRGRNLHRVPADVEISEVIRMAVENRWLVQDDKGRLYLKR